MKMLGWLGVGVLGMLVLIGVLAGLVFWLMRQGEAYQLAEQRILTDPRVREAVGTPVEIGWFISGSVKTVGDDGHADLAIPVVGPSGESKVDLEATLENGRWQLDELSLRRDGDSVDLLEPAQ